MNDRIKDLAEHCDFYVGNEHSNESYEEKQRLWVEKFAELIIQECMDIANKNRSAMEIDRQTNLTADAIKKHFGVEK